MAGLSLRLGLSRGRGLVCSPVPRSARTALVHFGCSFRLCCPTAIDSFTTILLHVSPCRSHASLGPSKADCLWLSLEERQVMDSGLLTVLRGLVIGRVLDERLGQARGTSQRHAKV